MREATIVAEVVSLGGAHDPMDVRQSQPSRSMGPDRRSHALPLPGPNREGPFHAERNVEAPLA
ncbi:MAG: hypothetical protein FJW35_08885 [Acidobacteria bacterium]|nr:hypothetical protein [Acidobacteriota bacterium]